MVVLIIEAYSHVHSWAVGIIYGDVDYRNVSLVYVSYIPYVSYMFLKMLEIT